MHKQKIVLFLILFFACLSSQHIFSQVGVSQTTGCAPMQVSFTAPPGAVSATWNFGSGPVNQLNASTVYNTPGTYNVTYSGTGGSPTSSVIVITVVPNNIAGTISFTVPPTHCAPMTVNFAATSNGGPGTSYQWAFGDGGGGQGASINYAYTLNGIFNPTLSITDAVSGCVGTATTSGLINVSLLPNVVISGNPGLASCQAPFTTAFSGTNSSSGSPLGPTLTYNWNFFGSAPPSTQASPGSVTYNTQGYYNVALSVTDDNNCSNSTTVVVSVVQPTLNATVPGTVCINGQQPYSPNFIFPYPTVQSSQPFTTWAMGDGNVITVPANPTSATSFTYYLYSTPGLKTLTITATIGNCVVTQTKTIFVEQIVPQFTFTPQSFTCSPSMVVSYVNQTTVNTGNALTYTWTASTWNHQSDPNYTSTATNPTFTITQASRNPYTYFRVYGSEVQLEVRSSQGCVTSINHMFDSIRRPTAWFNKDKRQGCAPLTVRFRDSSNTNTAIYPIQTYTWNNGANPPTLVSGIMPPAMIQPTFTYASPGTYTPYLVINTAGGCVDTSFVDTVIVVNPPTISSTFTPNLQVCAGQSVQINLSGTTSPVNGSIQHWHVETDDGFFSGCVSDPNPIWFFTHLGTHQFILSAYDHGCESDVIPAQSVLVTGPIAKGRFRTNCINKKSVEFYSHLQEVETAILDFGDGSPTYIITGNTGGTVSNTVTHVYGATGDYTATLTGSNSLGSCPSYSQAMVVNIREIQAGFDLIPVLCKGGLMTFTSSASVDVYATCSRGYTWFIDDEAPDQTSDTIYISQFDEPGTHTVTLQVRDINSCLATMTKTFIIDSPTPSFSFAANPACMSNMPLQIVNTTSQTPVSSSTFSWNFGTSPAPGSFSVTTSVNQWPIHSFTATVPNQLYTVSLTAVSDLYGCVSSYSQVLQVNRPAEVYLFSVPMNACIGQQVTFSGGTYVNIPFPKTIDFDDSSPLTVTSGTNFVHTYTAAGSYTPVLSYADDAGCIGSATTVVEVAAYPSAADFTFYPTMPQIPPTAAGSTVFCVDAITFSNTTNSAYPLSFYWYLNTNSPIIDSSVVQTVYTSGGVKTVTLLATREGFNCPAVISKSLAIVNPTATVVSDKTRLCVGETVKLHIKDSSDLLAWRWYFDFVDNTDTILATSLPSPTVSHTYTYFPQSSNGFVTINLIYYSPGYACRNTSTVGVQVTKVDADFKRNDELAVKDSVHCLNIADQFVNGSKINNSTFINGLYFNWDFGNGVSSSSISPAYTYPVPGVYTITLTVTDPQAGCQDISVKNMTINPIPTVSISLPDSVCMGSSFILNADASPDVSQFQWLPASGVVNANVIPATATATASTTYSLEVVSINGCKARSNIQYVYVQPPPPVFKWDTTVVIGQLSALNANVGPNYSYTWSPLTDLSCDHCPYPTSTSTTNITYSVEVEDNMGCFRVINTYSVFIDPLTSVDVPTAFTPNGDGVNDVIYVDGWGIKQLNYFRIFNRWGQLLFESTDIKVGWDGTYKGVPQNMETYVYQVSADTYIEGKSLHKTATFRLIR